MIIVEARIALNPGKKAAFIEAAQPVIAATRKEAGNIVYELLASTENENELMYFERWTDRGALDAHIKSAHMQAWTKTREELALVAGPSEVVVYDIA